MGLHDRDYARKASRGPANAPTGLGGFDPRTWSMTVWLIVINVLVFALGLTLERLPGAQGWTIVPSKVEWREGVTISQKWRSAAIVQQPADILLQTGAPRVSIDDGALLGRQTFVAVTHERAVGHFSTYNIISRLEIWRFVTFQFLHAGFFHIFVNMLSLWIFGPEVEEYLGRKKYLALYLVCGVFGALSYMVLNLLGNLVPSNWHVFGLLTDDLFTQLVGASAGIFGIMLAAAFVAPQRLIYIFYIVPLRMRAAAMLFLGMSIINLITGSSNAGGEAAHIGGGLAGYFFIRRMYLLRDFFDVLGDDSPAPSAKAAVPHPLTAIEQAEVDRLLAKISTSGRDSLTPEERATLEHASANMQKGSA